MRWNLDITSLSELAKDIELHLEQARQGGLVDGARGVEAAQQPAQGFPRYHAESTRLMGEQLAQRWRCLRCMSNDHPDSECPVALRARTKADLDEVVKRYTTYERQTLENGQRLDALTRSFGERLSKLEGTTAETRFVVGSLEALEKRIEAKLVELHARLGSVEKDRYEYATLTSRVHDLERYLHAGELPRDAYDRLGGGAGPRQGATADEIMAQSFPKHGARKLTDANITECLQGHKSVLVALETRLNEIGGTVDLLSKGLGACERHTERVEERLETTNALVSEHSAAIGKLEMAARGEVAGYQEQNRRIGKLESSAVDGMAHSLLMNRVSALENVLDGSATCRAFERFSEQLRKIESSTVSRTGYNADRDRLDKRCTIIDANHSANVRRLEVVERSASELHDKLAATGTVFDRRIKTLEEWHRETLARVDGAKLQTLGQKLEENKVMARGLGAQRAYDPGDPGEALLRPIPGLTLDDS